MTDVIRVPDGVTVSCPLLNSQQRYVVKGCLGCEYFKGTTLLTDAEEMPIKDPFTSRVIGKRKIHWHEKHLVLCGFPMQRRVADMTAFVEKE